MNQLMLDDCINRVRMARAIGMTPADIAKAFEDSFTPEMIFLSWHAACVLDKDEDE